MPFKKNNYTAFLAGRVIRLLDKLTKAFDMPLQAP